MKGASLQHSKLLQDRVLNSASASNKLKPALRGATNQASRQPKAKYETSFNSKGSQKKTDSSSLQKKVAQCQSISPKHKRDLSNDCHKSKGSSANHQGSTTAGSVKTMSKEKIQDDEELIAYVESFKQDIEEKFKSSPVNRNYHFQRESVSSSSGSSLNSIRNETIYDLASQNLRSPPKSPYTEVGSKQDLSSSDVDPLMKEFMRTLEKMNEKEREKLVESIEDKSSAAYLTLLKIINQQKGTKMGPTKSVSPNSRNPSPAAGSYFIQGSLQGPRKAGSRYSSKTINANNSADQKQAQKLGKMTQVYHTTSEGPFYSMHQPAFEMGKGDEHKHGEVTKVQKQVKKIQAEQENIQPKNVTQKLVGSRLINKGFESKTSINGKTGDLLKPKGNPGTVKASLISAATIKSVKLKQGNAISKEITGTLKGKVGSEASGSFNKTLKTGALRQNTFSSNDTNSITSSNFSPKNKESVFKSSLTDNSKDGSVVSNNSSNSNLKIGTLLGTAQSNSSLKSPTSLEGRKNPRPISSSSRQNPSLSKDPQLKNPQNQPSGAYSKLNSKLLNKLATQKQKEAHVSPPSMASQKSSCTVKNSHVPNPYQSQTGQKASQIGSSNNSKNPSTLYQKAQTILMSSKSPRIPQSSLKNKS